VAGYTSNAVTVLDRNPADGKLTFVECWASAAFNPDSCGHTVSGNSLGSATDVVMTADGSQLYASSRLGNDVVRFARNAGTGGLSDPQAFASAEALAGPQTLLAAPGGEALYVGLFDGYGLTSLARDQSTGVPSLLGCLARTANASCAASAGVYAVFGLGLSVDGRVLYAAARNGGTLASFRRAADGSLSLLECSRGALVPATGCERVVNGLDGVESVTASADGRFVYVGGDALVTLAPEYAPDCTPVSSPAPNSTAVELQLSCTDRNAQPLAYALGTPPAHGKVTALDAQTGRLRTCPTPASAGRTRSPSPRLTARTSARPRSSRWTSRATRRARACGSSRVESAPPAVASCA
jgi:hypothetical protein